jgi:cell volume regulation protein A
VQDQVPFGLLVLFSAAAGLAAVLSNRLSQRLLVPAPALFLVAAALAVRFVPALHEPPHVTVERVVTVALVLILFDGGMHIGVARLRSAAGAIALVGLAGTFLTTGAVALLAHLAFGLDWYLALLVGAAVAPTDPAVVFSVLGQRELSGRSGTVLEGESGANDPVGIALMASLVSAGGVSLGAAGSVAVEFVLQMVVGAVVGVAGGRLMLGFLRTVPLPSEALYPVRTLAGSLLLFGLATVAHGSGFLAVFAAGIVLGDAHAPYKREIRRFHAALASLGEIVAFVVLGLTVDLGVLARTDVWVPGLVLGVALAVAVRPLLVGLCLLPARLDRNETAFVLFAGLKGAVPILLGTFLFSAHLADAPRLYGIIVVVVVFSVVVQGSLVPGAARLLRLPMRQVEPEPWTLGVRLRDEPEGVHQLEVGAGSVADGSTIADLSTASDDIWVSLVVRGGRLVPVRADAALRAGDAVVVLADAAAREALEQLFAPHAPAAVSPRSARRPSRS